MTGYRYTTGSSLGTALSTVSYGYDTVWKDKLTSYDGQSITYDEIGNPLSYRDGRTLTWQNGRQLASITKEGYTSSYQYDVNGIRTKKTVDDVTTEYLLDGSRILAEKTGTDVTWYNYDGNGNIVGFEKNNASYYYVRNGQGDIIGILDSSYTQVVSYTYDSWGKVLSITGTLAETIGQQNPFRYRGYYYDSEVGLYYLQSRYYDPVTCRFLNADEIAGFVGDLLSHNVFAYCGNNPVNYSDPTGLWEQIGSVIYISDKWTYDTYYGDKSKWVGSKTYIYDPGYKLYKAESARLDRLNQTKKNVQKIASNVKKWVQELPGNIGKASDKIWNGLTDVVNSNQLSGAGHMAVGFFEFWTGLQAVGSGLGAIATPEPTALSKIGGVALATLGVGSLINGLQEMVIFFEENE